ncbi:MAG: TonB-dependent receptor [Muribaculaceae bacterium]|nr:TonB-dependent receptor [Muribaculaceae bacterium]
MSRKVWLAALLTLCFSFPALAQKITVSGTVLDPEGEPLIGASVLVKGETMGTATDIDGNYTLQSPKDGTLVFSYVGYDTQEIAVDGRTTINVNMAENSLLLGEVVAIGYGTVKKSDATGAVATVKPTEIEAGLATSAQDLLVGASPGVVVTTDGSPQGGASIVIRGGASISATNDPLIVIDGVPMSTKSVYGASNPLALVSPENVESMTILKDASATAIYGSRASNGVIIITTKKGMSGRPQVTFTANAYINTPRKLLDVMDGDQFRKFIIDRYGEESAQAAQLGIYNTNWQREATRTTLSSDYSLSVGGTVGVLPYRVGVTYTNNNGVLKKTGMDRVTGSISLTPKFFNNSLSVNANLKGSYVTNDYADNTLGTCATMNPTIPVRDYENGSPIFSYWTSYNAAGEVLGPDAKGQDLNTATAPVNPISQILAQKSEGKSYQSIGNLQLNYKLPFLPELSADLNLAYDYQHGTWEGGVDAFTPKAWANGWQYPVYNEDGSFKEAITVKDGGTMYTKQNQTRMNLLLDFVLNYNKYFDAIKTQVDVTGGYSWQKFKNKGRSYSYVNRVGDPANDKYLGVQANPTDRFRTPHQLVSFFGRVNFVFLDKYLLTGTVRRDGTSRFSKDNRWGTFPAVAVGWKILEEDFMEGTRGFLNELKIRGGYGVTGQQDIGDDYFPYLPVYSQWTGTGSIYPALLPGGSPVYPVSPEGYNAAIKWEETHTWNGGIDFGFMNNRIAGSFEVYKRETKDLLFNTTYPAGSNITNKGNMNIGNLENIGIEFNITTRPIVTTNLTWTSAFNIGWNKNKITKLAEGADTNFGGVGTDLTAQKHAMGYAASSFYVYEQVYDSNGDPVDGCFVDRNGDGQINEADKYFYHSPTPKVTLTWNNTVNWKNWDFGIVLRSNMGNWLYNANMSGTTDKASNNALPLTNMMRGVYLFEDQDTNTKLSDYWVQNASFLRCDNITIGYTWRNLLKDNLRLRLYGAVQNPFVITKYKGIDPEVSGGIDGGVYPRPVTFSVGLVASF